MSKHYIIIGGSKGIGRALVNEITSIGHQVTVYSRTRGDLDSSINHIAFDATTDEFPKDTLPEEIHGLAYCPGSITLKPFRFSFVERRNLPYRLQYQCFGCR